MTLPRMTKEREAEIKIWILKLDRTQEGYFRSFDGPSIDGPGPIQVVEKKRNE